MSEATLSVAQARIYTDPARFRVAVCGRRFGKTFLALWEIWRAATQARHRDVIYIAPTYSSAKETMWLPLMNFIPPQLIRSKNVSDMSIELVNGSYIRLTGAQTDTGIRGRGRDFVILDECSSIDADIYQQAVLPSLADKQGGLLAIGTPVGFNWFYDMWLNENHTALQGIWKSFQFTTLQGGQVSPQEIELHKVTLQSQFFQQEYLASFESLFGRVYSFYSPQKHDHVTEVNDKLPLLLGIDFNVNPMTAVLGQLVRNPKGDKELHIHDEFYLPNSTTFEMAEEIKNRYPKRKIIAYPDASGSARKSSSVNTDHDILRKNGFEVVTDKSNPRIADRINEVQSAFLSATKNTKLYINPKCVNLKKSMAGLTYKEGTTLPDKSSGLDHMADALGYMVHHIFPLVTTRYGQSSLGL